MALVSHFVRIQHLFSSSFKSSLQLVNSSLSSFRELFMLLNPELLGIGCWIVLVGILAGNLKFTFETRLNAFSLVLDLSLLLTFLWWFFSIFLTASSLSVSVTELFNRSLESNWGTHFFFCFGLTTCVMVLASKEVIRLGQRWCCLLCSGFITFTWLSKYLSSWLISISTNSSVLSIF